MRPLLALLLAASVLALAGCSGGDEAAGAAPEGAGPKTAAEAQKSNEERIAEIQKDPNMPAAEKQRAIAALTTNMGNAPKKR